MAIIVSELRDDGVRVLTLDDTAAAQNTITPQLLTELGEALAAATADYHTRAIVVRSGKPSFLVGADLELLRAIRFAQDARDAAREVSRHFAEIAASHKPFVACVHGAALGGGFELVLACAAAVASDDETTSFGLPESKLGLMPAANGLLRVAQRAGLQMAIDLGLSGRTIPAVEALRLGLVDEVAHDALEAACHLALRLAARPKLRRALPRRRAWMRHRGSVVARLLEAPRLVLERTPFGRRILFRRARAEAATRTRGHYPAAARILDVVARFGARGFASAAKLEAELFGELAVSETSQRLVELLFAEGATRKDPGLEAGEYAEPSRIEEIAVIGREQVSARAGLRVRATSREGSALISADLVVDATLEDRADLRGLEARVKKSCVIASSARTVAIADLGAASSYPERLLGMRHGRALVEVARGAKTDARAVATAVAVGRTEDRTVIVLRDVFYTTRILVPFLNEAAHLLGEGVSVETIDGALLDWGFPQGPLRMLDEIGIEVAARAASRLEPSSGARARVPDALLALVKDSRQGRVNGRGFYQYDRDRDAEKNVDNSVYRVVRVKPRAPSMPEELSLRCTMALVNEALRCLDEGVLRSARDGDVGAVLGIGFPPFRGGPFRYVDVLGAPEVLRRTRSLEQRFGERFEPAPLLVDMARHGKRFYD